MRRLPTEAPERTDIPAELSAQSGSASKTMHALPVDELRSSEHRTTSERSRHRCAALFLLVDTPVSTLSPKGSSHDQISTHVSRALCVHLAAQPDSTSFIQVGPWVRRRRTGPGEEIRISGGVGDIYLQKLDPDGNLVWVETFRGTGNDAEIGVEADGEGNVYATGYFGGSIDFGTSTTDYQYSTTSRNVFIGGFGPDGVLNWLEVIGGAGLTEPSAIRIGPLGSVHVCGQYYDQTRFFEQSALPRLDGNGRSDAFVLKFGEDITTGVNAPQFTGPEPASVPTPAAAVLNAGPHARVRIFRPDGRLESQSAMLVQPASLQRASAELLVVEVAAGNTTRTHRIINH